LLEAHIKQSWISVATVIFWLKNINSQGRSELGELGYKQIPEMLAHYLSASFTVYTKIGH
jgi:hypothetical protein